MSDAVEPTAEGSVHQAEDRINFPKIITIGAVSVIVFALGIVWAWAILRTRPQRVGPGSTEGAEAIGKAEIGIVDHIPFDVDRRRATWQADAERRLATYGWVDRRAGVVHIPIDRAIDRVLAEGVGPRPRPTGEARPSVVAPVPTVPELRGRRTVPPPRRPGGPR